MHQPHQLPQKSSTTHLPRKSVSDSVEDWKAAVSKYQIPWVNVYNDSSVKEGRPDQTYAVQGYPTKIIINPEGKIAKIVTGEDPQFYTDLDNFLQ